MSLEMSVNSSLVSPTQTELNISMTAEGNQSNSSYPASTTSVYDHLGAMRFTVAVVLVYGVGVIGVLGIYVSRRSKERQERDTSSFLKGLQKHREMIEKSEQLSAVQDVIQAMHGPVPHFTHTPPSTIVATPGESPSASVRRYCLESPLHGGCPEIRPLMARRHAIPRYFPHTVLDRQDSQESTADAEEDDVVVSNGCHQTPGGEAVSIHNDEEIGKGLLNCDQDLATMTSSNASGDNSVCTVRKQEHANECGNLVCKHNSQRGVNVNTNKAQAR